MRMSSNFPQTRLKRHCPDQPNTLVSITSVSFLCCLLIFRFFTRSLTSLSLPSAVSKQHKAAHIFVTLPMGDSTTPSSPWSLSAIVGVIAFGILTLFTIFSMSIWANHKRLRLESFWLWNPGAVNRGPGPDVDKELNNPEPGTPAVHGV